MLFEIIKKELKRVFTDRRLVISTFIIPAVSIYVLYTLMGSMVGNMVSDIEEHESTVLVSGAPESFVEYFTNVKSNYNMNVTFGNYSKDDQAEDIRTNKLDLLIQFESDFENKIQTYQELANAPEIKTYYNPAEQYSAEARSNFVHSLLEGYRQVLLTERFKNINYVKGFDVDSTDQQASAIVDEKKASSSSLGMMIPMLLAIILFAGAMGIGMDTIAGEKERGTMATLLLTPVPRETIALGKVIGLGIVAIISSSFSFIAIIASLPNMMSSVSEGEGGGAMKLVFDGGQYVELFIIMIALVGIYVGLICLISVRARSVKEAGTYVAPVYMIIMVAAFSTMFTTAKDIALYKFAIPVYGNVMAIKKMFSFELTFQQFAVSTGVAFVLTALLIVLITKTFNDEKVMFNA